MIPNLARLFAVAEPERLARLRELRMAARLLLGPQHALVGALGAAAAGADLGDALAALDALPAIPKRRLLAALAEVL